MSVYTNNITIERGTNFSIDYTLSNTDSSVINLTNYTVTAKVRKHFTATDSVGFAVSFVDAANGKIRISMASTVTSTLKSGRNVYDVLVTDASNKTTKAIKGMAFVEDTASL